MIKRWLSVILRKSWLRVMLAVVLLVIGLAPVGAPIMSDSAFREALRPNPTPAQQPATYRFLVNMQGQSQIQRAESVQPSGLRLPWAGNSQPASTWRTLGTVPDAVQQLAPVAGNENVLMARGSSALWRSTDGGTTWARVALPSRPAALAVAKQTAGLIFAGTDSDGLYRSTDGGVTWQLFGKELAGSGAGALGVTAIAFNPDNEQVVYAAPGFWVGSTEMHFAPLGVFISADYGGHWLSMVEGAPVVAGEPTGQPTPLPVEMITDLRPTARPLVVAAAGANAQGATTPAPTHTYELPVTPGLVRRLDDADPGVRGSVALLLGLSGNHSVLTALLDHLKDPDALAGERVAEAIGQLKDPTAVPTLRVALSDKDELVRARAAEALGLLHADAAVPQLAEMVAKDGPEARGRAAEALGRIATPAAITALMQSLAGGSTSPAREAAMHGLELAGPAATAQLTAALHNPDPTLRRNAAEMLGWNHPANATDALAAALSDADPAVRGQAAWALGEIGTLDAQRALAQAANAEKDQAARQTVQQALAQAQATARERPGLALSPWAAFADAATQVPITNWTFLLLAMTLAALLLAARPRPMAGERMNFRS
jgi:HEAT repeat protein